MEVHGTRTMISSNSKPKPYNSSNTPRRTCTRNPLPYSFKNSEMHATHHAIPNGCQTKMMILFVCETTMYRITFLSLSLSILLSFSDNIHASVYPMKHSDLTTDKMTPLRRGIVMTAISMLPQRLNTTTILVDQVRALCLSQFYANKKKKRLPLIGNKKSKFIKWLNLLY